MSDGTGSGWETPGSVSTPSAPVGGGTGSGWEIPGGGVAPPHSGGGSGGGGFLGGIGHFVSGVGHTLATQASRAGHLIAATPGGLASQANTVAIQPWWATITGHNAFNQHSSYQKNIGKVIDQNVASIEHTINHPGENWLATAMLAAPALHGVGRVGIGAAEAGAALKAGEGVGAAAARFRTPDTLTAPRTLRQTGGESVTLNSSRNALRRGYQAAHDAYVQRMMDSKPNSRVAAYGASRVHGSLAEVARARVRMRQAVTSNLRAATQPLKGEIAKAAKSIDLTLKNAPKTIAQAAIELVSHNTTPEEAILRAEHAIRQGINPELNAANIELYTEIDHLDLVHTLGAKVGINPEFERTARAEAILHEGGTALDQQIAERGLRPVEQLENRRNLPAAVTQRLKPFAENKVSPALRDASDQFERVDRLYNKALQREHDWHYENTQDVADVLTPGRTGGRSVELDNPYRERLIVLGHKHEEALQRLQRLEKRHGKGRYTVVPEDLQARSDLIRFATEKFGREEALNRVGLIDRRAGQFGNENDVPATEFYKRFLRELKTSPTLERLPKDIAPLYEAARPLPEEPLPNVSGSDLLDRIEKTGDLALPKGVTREQFAALIDDTIMPLVRQGAPYRDWYTRGAKVIKDAARRLGVPVKKMIDLVAVTSQGANPTFNLRLAVKAVREHQETGKVTNLPLQSMVDKQMEMTGAKQPAKGWSGYLFKPDEALASLEGRSIETIKRNSYRGNFLHEIDPKAFAKEYGDRIDPVTVDRHIARMFGFGSSPTTAQYALIERVFQEMGKDLGWKAKEVQAAAWVPWKAANEMKSALARATGAGRADSFDQSLERFMPNAADAYEAGHAENIGTLYHEAPALQRVLDTNAGHDLRGLPATIKVNGEPVQWHSYGPAQDVAAQYMRDTGLPYDPPATYARVDPERAASIAHWYEEAQHAPADPRVASAYAAMARETLAQYEAITKAGYTFEFYPGHDPYPGGPREAILDLIGNKHMYVYPTDEGFGTIATETQHPLLADSGVRWGGKTVTHNDVFRAVHDFFGHAKEGVGFRADGEENAWRSHSAMYTPEARAAMTAETRGQNSWVNYGPHGEANRTASQLDTVYADQKAVVAPDWVVHDGAGDAPSALYSKKGGVVRGSYSPKTTAMEFSEKHAIPETVTHEALHAIRQSLPELLLRKFERRYDVRDGQWTRADEEHFVNDMLGVHNGTVTDPELVRNFHQLTDFVPGRTWTPLKTLEAGTPTSIVARSQGPVVGLAADPLESHFTTGSGLLGGRHQEDVIDATARHWHNVFRFFNTQDWRSMIAKTGNDVRRSDRDILVRVDNRAEGGVHVNAGKLTTEIETLLGRKRDTSYMPEMEGEDAAIMASLQKFVTDMFPGTVEDFADTPLGEPAPAGHVWVDSKVVGDVALPSLGRGNAYARFFDNVNAAVTAATVYFKLGHFLTRVLTNAATNIMQGSASPLNIKESLSAWHELAASERLDALAASGTHYYEAIPGATGETRIARAIQHGIGPNHALSPHWWATVVDAPFRFNSLSYEVRKSAYGGGVEGIRSFLGDLHDYNALDEAQRAEVDGVVRRANQQAIAYDRLNAPERAIFSRAIWFYPWVKGSSVWTMQQFFEHPWKSAYLANSGVQGMREQKAAFGDLPTFSYGLFELAHGKPFPLTANWSTFNPEATLGDVLQIPQHFDTAAGMANPALGTLEHLATSTDAYGTHTNHPVSSALQSLVSATPESQIAQAYLGRHDDQSHREFPAVPGDAFSKTYIGEILRALIGPGTPRRFNPEAAHSLAERERTGR